MEVVHRHVEEEELPRQRQRPDFGDGFVSSDETNSDGTKEEEMHENGTSTESVYLDKIEDAKIPNAEDEVDISKLVTAIINRQSIIGNHEILSVSSVKTEEDKTSIRVEAKENVIVDVVGEESEDEVIELELERAVEKVHTHTPYCPNCSNQITKVVLRRKNRRSPRQDKPLDLFGCFSCFRIFIPSGDSLNPFGFFGSKPKPESPALEDVGGGTTITAAGKNSVNPLNCFGYKTKQELIPEKIEEEKQEASISGVGSGTIHGIGPSVIHHQPLIHNHGEGSGTVHVIRPQLPLTRLESYDDDDSNAQSSEFETPQQLEADHPIHHVQIGIPEQQLISGDQHSKSVELVKCIVHGGLLESIASLSVISSVAASGTTTTNVVTIGLATLFSGLIAFFYSLIDLRNDVGSNEKYEEILGAKGHFLYHSTFAIFSYLLFGLVAPTTYGFAFRESDNKDYKIIAVAAAGFACVLILAIAKAYVRGADKFGSYVKTVLYYVTMVVSASGVAYAAGDLIGMLLEKFGWFDSVQGLTPPTRAWASY